MKESYFHFDAYRLAIEIADKNKFDRSKTIDEICEYFGYEQDGDIAKPVCFEELLEEFESHSIARHIYNALISYFDEVPTGKVYIDF